MLGKILCFLGFHNFRWKKSELELEDDWEYWLNNANPPDFARCIKCGKRYGD